MNTIKFYYDERGISDIEEYVKKLSKEITKKDSRIKLGHIDFQIKLLREIGPNGMSSIYVKHIVDGIWELRPGNIRIMFYVDNNEYVLLSYFFKKTNRLPKRELEKAERLRDKYIEGKKLL